MSHNKETTHTKTCYQCEEECNYLFPDARCKDCTRITPEELRGDILLDDYE